MLRAKIVTLAMGALALSGCALTQREPISQWHIVHNDEIAQSERQMIVRNVLRARDQESMVFTRVTQVTGSSRRTIGGELGAELGAGEDTVSPGVSFEQSANPGWTIDVLASQEFMQGILRPVDVDILEYYVDQGWPKELFGYLFVEKVWITTPVPGLCETGHCMLDNDPENAEAFRDFEKWLSHIDRAEICARLPSTVARYAGDFKDLGDLIALANAEGLSISSGFLRAQRGADLCVRGEEGISYYTIRGQSEQANPHGEDARKRGEIQLRSLQGAIYYLGEGLRTPDDVFIVHPSHALRGRNCQDGDPCPVALFGVAKTNSPLGGVEVEHHGVTYYTPYRDRRVGDELNDRSQMVISLLLQMLGLYQKSTERLTTNVRVVN